IVEARDLGNAEPLHDNKAGAINDGKGLVGKSFADGPSRFQIGRRSRCNCHASATDTVPEAFSRLVVIAAVQQQPRLDHDVIGRDVTAAAFQNLARALLRSRATTEANHTDESTKILNDDPSQRGFGATFVRFFSSSFARLPRRSSYPCCGRY